MVMAGRELERAREEIQAAQAATSSSVPSGSPEWWRDRLLKRMINRDRRLVLLDDYYSGDHPLLFQTDPFRKAFGRLFEGFADNWCDLVVDATEERCNVEGVRIAGETSANNELWEHWRRNAMDAEAGIAHTESLISAESHALVWWGLDGLPEISIEHARTMIVETEPTSRLRRRAALKRWRDDDDRLRVTLYLPGEIYKWRSRQAWASSSTLEAVTFEAISDEEDPSWPIENPLGRVPVVPLWTKPRLLRAGESELEQVIPLQNATNKLLADMLVASEFGGFRQRWATGIEIPTDDEGNPIETFRAAIDRLWVANKPADAAPEEPEPRFGEFAATDLKPYVAAIELVVQHVASKTRTPPHYFYLGGGQPPSGESIKSAETGLVVKAKRRMRHWGQAWAEVFALVDLVAGDARRAAAPKEIVWADPESRSESEHTDALVKKSALGVPQEALWSEAGYTPQEIDRFRAMRAEEGAALSGLAELMPLPPAGDDAAGA